MKQHDKTVMWKALCLGLAICATVLAAHSLDMYMLVAQCAKGAGL